jgi:beta-lactamase regulating signal transducer with metallopeptidase domain
MSALLAWLWQGAALACATALVLRLLPRVGASTRHAAWWLTLAGVLALPGGALFDVGHGRAEVASVSAPALEIPSPPGWALDVAVGAWAAHAVLGLVGIAGGFRWMRRLRRSSQPLPRALQTRLSRCVPGAGSRPAAVKLSHDLEGAAALGLGSPLILLSARLVETLRPCELELLVAHEQAHLARRDDWTRLLEAVIDAFAGLHPAVWFISRQIDIEREAACDDWAVARAGDAVGYAECLTRVAAFAGGRAGAPAVLPGMLRRPSSLRRRVTRLLDARRSRAARLSRGMLLATATALAVAALGVFRVPPVVIVDARAWADLPRVDSPPFTAADPGVALLVPTPAIDGIKVETGASITGGRSMSQAVRPEQTRTAASEAPTRRMLRGGGGAATEPVPPLVAARLDGLALPAAPEGRPVAALEQSTDTRARSPWARTADAGASVGAETSRAGRAVAGAARTAGRSIGGWFGRAADRF